MTLENRFELKLRWHHHWSLKPMLFQYALYNSSFNHCCSFFLVREFCYLRFNQKYVERFNGIYILLVIYVFHISLIASWFCSGNIVHLGGYDWCDLTFQPCFLPLFYFVRLGEYSIDFSFQKTVFFIGGCFYNFLFPFSSLVLFFFQ